MWSNIVTNILMGFKVSCEVGGHGQKIKITTCTYEFYTKKIEKSPTRCKFENFDPDPQLDIKF